MGEREKEIRRKENSLSFLNKLVCVCGEGGGNVYFRYLNLVVEIRCRMTSC